jgi:hypothetical protein
MSARRAPHSSVVAAGGVGAGQVVGGAEGAGGGARGRLRGRWRRGRRRPGRGRAGGRCPGVADQPFVVDHVRPGGAVGDGADGEAAAGGRAEGPMAGMGAGGHEAVGGEEARLVVAAPDHVLAEELSVGELGEGGEGAGDHRLVAADDAGGGAQHDVGGVVVAERGDAALLPDLAGDLEDVVGEVGEPLLEALHARALAMRSPVRRSKRWQMAGGHRGLDGLADLDAVVLGRLDGDELAADVHGDHRGLAEELHGVDGRADLAARGHDGSRPRRGSRG